MPIKPSFLMAALGSAALGLVACAGSGPRTPPAAIDLVGSAGVDAGAADARAAGVVDAAVDGAPTLEDSLRRMRTPRSAQVIAEDLQRLAESRARFDALARAHDGTYVYVTGFGSWTSVDAKTTMRVERGVLVERRFEVTRSDGQRQKRLAGWTEKGSKVGSHVGEGDAPMRLEERYDDCAQLISLTDRVDHLLIWLDFDDRGLLAHCGSQFKECSDPCWQGTSVRSLTFGP